jgi:hypothetical protein
MEQVIYTNRMTKGLPWGTVVLALMTSLGANAQNAPRLYTIKIAGTGYTTDSEGRIKPHPINNLTLLREAARAGNTDISWLGLAYHVKATDLGDTIEVIDRRNGHAVKTLFGLYFGEDTSLGRTGLVSGSARQIKRIEYVYTEQNSHSMGSALITTYNYTESNGSTNNIMNFGTLQYIINPDATHSNTEVRTASFTTGAPWHFAP